MRCEYLGCNKEKGTPKNRYDNRLPTSNFFKHKNKWYCDSHLMTVTEPQKK